ncbi:MAG: 1-acyl-sn-glycerol-3-phosphate acyltransferase [Desulfocapsaceae bacterium]|jgi:1-acyl-sn-glycerol-3-phosphate acyltransferase|nr:1-acyl-sn-glycerol-3-phosphate acyltransferase [Desulfocapsaceae bacterium]
MIKAISSFILSIWGWKTSHTTVAFDKYVLIGAPHTSNWDFPLTLLGLSSMGITFNWVAKHTLFFRPLGSLLKAIGGIPVDRGQGASFLKKIIELYEEKETLILAIAPEGTRSRTRYWKTGFYTIAQRAGVPIGLGYIDYSRKMIGIEKFILASGDIEADFEVIKDYYQDKWGRYPEKQGEICVRRKKSKASRGNTGPGTEAGQRSA